MWRGDWLMTDTIFYFFRFYNGYDCMMLILLILLKF